MDPLFHSENPIVGALVFIIGAPIAITGLFLVSVMLVMVLMYGPMGILLSFNLVCVGISKLVNRIFRPARNRPVHHKPAHK